MWRTAHDSITAAAADGYVLRIRAAADTLRQDAGVRARARASLEIAHVLDEVRELLNADMAQHGRVVGLASNALIANLKSLGYLLTLSAQTRRYPAPLDL